MKLQAGVSLWSAQHAVRARLKELMSNERGEVASWLILAAGLALVAVFAAGELDTFIRDLVADITGGGGGGDAGAGGPGAP